MVAQSGRRVAIPLAALLIVAGVWVVCALLDNWLLLPGVSFKQSFLLQVPLANAVQRLVLAGVILAWFMVSGWRKQRRQPASQTAPTDAPFCEYFLDAGVALCRTSLDGQRFIFANELAAKLLGYPDVATLVAEGQPVLLYVDERAREQLINQLYVFRVVDGIDLWLRRRDGRAAWVRIYAKLRPLEDAIDVAAIDVTSERDKFSRLHESEQLHRAIIENSPVGITVRDRRGKLLQYNEAWAAIWAIPPEAIRADMERERDDLVFDKREDYLGQRSSAVMRVYKHGGTAFIPECQTHQRRPGSATWVSQHFYAILNDLGEVDRVVILTEDISERKQAEHERNEMLAELEHNAEQIRLLSGLVPICSGCHKIRDDSGYWQQVDMFLQQHSPLELSHSLCPECAKRLYPELMLSDDEQSSGL